MKLLDIVHPAAKILVDISLSQDAEVTYMEGGGERRSTYSRDFAVKVTHIDFSPVDGWGL